MLENEQVDYNFMLIKFQKLYTELLYYKELSLGAQKDPKEL